jgi:hypothetical protein
MYVQDVQGFAQSILGLWLFQEAPTEAATDAGMELETSLNNFLQTPVEIQEEQRPALFEEVIRKVGLCLWIPKEFGQKHEHLEHLDVCQVS